ncbi:MAG: hypothetical protein AAGG01_20860 [Planctomycetota bacterium]
MNASFLLISTLFLVPILGASARAARLPQAVTPRPDVDLTAMFQHGAGQEGRVMDMAYTSNGYLVVAYSEHAPGQASDRLVVAHRTPQGAWELLSNQRYGLGHILELKLAVPERGDGRDPKKDRVYIAVHVASDVGLGQRPGGDPAELEAIGLVSGPWLTPWNGVGRASFALVNGEQVPPRWRETWTPGIACVPVGSTAQGNYAIELAYAHPIGESGSGMGIYRTWSSDFGRSLEDPLQLAGPEPDFPCRPELCGDEYRSPSLTADWRRSRIVVAMEDRSADVVHVAGAWPGQPLIELLHSTEGLSPSGTQVVDRTPVIVSSEGDLVMTHLTLVPGATLPFAAIQLLSGNPITGDLQPMRQIHSRAATACDVDLKGEHVFLTARVYEDDQWPQQAFLRAWDLPLNDATAFPLTVLPADRINECVHPRIAARHAGEPWASVGYGQRDWLGPGTQTPAAGHVMINE